MITWKYLRHANVLELVGVIMAESQFAMVSEWMMNGNINEFIEANPDANRFGLVSPPLNLLLLLAVTDHDTIPTVSRRRERLKPHALSGDDSRGVRFQGHELQTPSPISFQRRIYSSIELARPVLRTLVSSRSHRTPQASHVRTHSRRVGLSGG